jgi:hypothetical protein
MKYTVITLHQNAGQNHTLLITNTSSEKDAKFKHLGTTLTIEIALTKKRGAV